MLSEAAATGTPARCSSVTRVRPRGVSFAASRPCRKRFAAGSVTTPMPARAKPSTTRAASRGSSALSAEQWLATTLPAIPCAFVRSTTAWKYVCAASRCSSRCRSIGLPWRSATANARSSNSSGRSPWFGFRPTTSAPRRIDSSSHSPDGAPAFVPPPVRKATTCSRIRSRERSRKATSASTPRSFASGSTFACVRIATVPRSRQAAIVLSARAVMSSALMPAA